MKQYTRDDLDSKFRALRKPFTKDTVFLVLEKGERVVTTQPCIECKKGKPHPKCELCEGTGEMKVILW